jgi:capsule polysaccharide export protein KpsE/RkpR
MGLPENDNPMVVELSPFYKLVGILFQKRKSLIIINIVTIALSLLLVINLPLWYQSTAIVVVQSESNAGGVAAMLAQVSPFPMGLAGGDKVTQYMGFIQTERVLDSIVVRFDLQELYEKKTRFHTYQQVRDFLTITDRDDGTFAISYKAEEDPELASAVANEFFNELYGLAIDVNRAKVSKYRSYLENSYNSGEEKLQVLLDQFKSFQDSTGVISLENQVHASLGGLAEIESEKMKNQIELEYLMMTLKSGDPQIVDIRNRITAIDDELNKYIATGKYSNIPILEIPKLSIQYMNMYREVEVQVKIVEYLALQLEQAKSEEQKQSADLYLVNPATPADYKSEPKRLNVLVAIIFFTNTLFMLFVSIKRYVEVNKSFIGRIINSE